MRPIGDESARVWTRLGRHQGTSPQLNPPLQPGMSVKSCPDKRTRSFNGATCVRIVPELRRRQISAFRRGSGGWRPEPPLPNKGKVTHLIMDENRGRTLWNHRVITQWCGRSRGIGEAASRLAAFTEFRKISALIVNKLPGVSH